MDKYGNPIYAVTIVDDLRTNSGRAETICFFHDLEDAKKMLENNEGDFYNFGYRYAVIEKVHQGLHKMPDEHESRWFYKFNRNLGKYEPVSVSTLFDGFFSFQRNEVKDIRKKQIIKYDVEVIHPEISVSDKEKSDQAWDDYEEFLLDIEDLLNKDMNVYCSAHVDPDCYAAIDYNGNVAVEFRAEFTQGNNDDIPFQIRINDNYYNNYEDVKRHIERELNLLFP